jgi:subtilisin family serine protease
MKGERLLKRTFFIPLLALGVLLLTATSGAFGAASATGSGAAFESSTGAWFVELSSTPEAFNAKAKGAGLQYTERFKFDKLWKGVSVKADAETAQLMRGLEGVVSVHSVDTVSLSPIEKTSDPELENAIKMTGADVAQTELGLDGTGIKVGVMDTGIDYNNPALGGCFGAGCRVFTGHDFVGDAYDAGGSGGALIPHPDNNPDDCNGHGTHVSGIVGANGTVNTVALKGVAPGVTFGAYRVFGCGGSTSEDIMMAAMELALADGMDVLNASIGDAFAWDTEPLAVAMNSAVARGMVVVFSAGNSGTNGLYSLSSAGNAAGVIGVASFDNSHVELSTFTAEPDDASFGYIPATGAPDPPTSGTQPLTRTGTPTTANDACNVVAPAAGSLTGKVALIRRGTCTFREKVQNAQTAGAVGVVIYNNSPGLFSGTVVGTTAPEITIPVVTISDGDGAILSGRIPTALTGTVDITWTDDKGTFPNPTAGQPSSFTSWGLAPTLGLKPDIGAPGGLIKSTWPMELGGFATISGTSMAAPHVSGAAALYLEAHGTTPPLELRDILQNNAIPANLPAPNSAFAHPVHRQGAGMLQIDDAILATSRVTPAKLKLGEGTAAQTKTLTITNSGPSVVTYAVAHQLAVGTSANTFAPGLIANFATVSFSSSSVTVPAGGTSTVDVTITPNAAANRTIYTGYIRLTPAVGSPLRVPYGGFTGDYQTIQVLAPGACTFPGVFKAGGSTTCAAGPPAVNLTGWTRQAAGATYNVGDRPDRPVVLYHLAHQSERVEIRAVNASNQEFLVARTNLAERNPTNDLTPPGQSSGPGFFVFTWDGKAVFVNERNGTVNRRGLPSGTYRLRIVVTKALAEAANPAHTETWDSPTMNIVAG